MHALLIQSGNPASVCPDSNRVRQGLMRDDLFTVVHEQFLTETARYADIVLPATMFLEHDDIYQAGGHSHIQIGRQVIEAPGEARSNHDLVCALAQRFGLDHPSFRMTGLELADATLRASGYPGAEELTARRWVDVQLPFGRRTSWTASRTRTGASTSARTGGRWATRRACCRSCRIGRR